MAIAAPVIVEEMSDWTAKGGGNSGIVGGPGHNYGFHMSANQVGPEDYSRWRDPNGSNGPYVNWDYACAGDFYHGKDYDLMVMHADVLQRLMRGELPMICEFIGKPYPGQDVLYWARWNGIQTLELYSGDGHDTWSHISWYRSMADQRAYLWVPQVVPVPTRKNRGDMRPFVIIQPNRPGSGIGLAWPSEVAKGWVYTNIIAPGSSSTRAEFPSEVVSQYLLAGCIDGRGWNVDSWDGYIPLSEVPGASVELGNVNVSVPPLKVVPL